LRTRGLAALYAARVGLMHRDLDPDLALLGWLALLPCLVAAWRELRGQRFLPAGANQHLWLGASVALAWLWSLQVRALGGLEVGLLGGAFVTLLFGRARAFLALLAALALHAIFAGGSWINLGLNALLLAALPAWLTGWAQGRLARHLPHNVFVFMIGNGLFVVFAVTALTAIARIALAAALAPAGTHLQWEDAVAYALLLAWGEALLLGMVFSALVIYRPEWVMSYHQDTYLPPRRRSS
jgi:uncharacterized membrane protein